MKAIALLLVSVGCAAAQPIAGIMELGEPPRHPVPPPAVSGEVKSSVKNATNFSLVTVSNREAVRSFFNTVYLASENVAMDWSGNVATCTPGTNSFEYLAAVLRRINYYRAMAGVPANVQFNPLYNNKAQAAALMMSVNHALNHFPPDTWSCYSPEGYEAAGKSNLSLGTAGPESVDGQMEDNGANNQAVGHRRWLLYPQTYWMGSGNVTPSGTYWAANVIWVVDANYGTTRPSTREPYVAWPPPGFTPYPVVFPRWSFSYPAADFSATTVTMSSNGVPLSVRLEPAATGFGENTIVWIPANLETNLAGRIPVNRPAADIAYRVQLGNVRVNGSPRTFEYTVTVIDPEVPSPDAVEPVILGPAEPGLNQPTRYSYAPVPMATGYRWRQATRQPYTESENGQHGLTNFTVETSAGYPVLTNTPGSPNAKAFHLAHPDPPQDQRLTLDHLLLVKTNGQLQFRSRLGYATDDQEARVELSQDEGKSWTTIYRQMGNNSNGESEFSTRTISLSNYVGRSIQVRFVYGFSQGNYFDLTGWGFGWHLDDIAFANTDRLRDIQVHDPGTATEFLFVPVSTNGQALQAAAEVYEAYFLPWGPAKLVTPTATATLVNITRFPVLNGNQLALEFTVTNFRSSLSFRLERTANVAGGWNEDPGASFQVLVPNSKFRVTTIQPAAAMFYRVRAD